MGLHGQGELIEWIMEDVVLVIGEMDLEEEDSEEVAEEDQGVERDLIVICHAKETCPRDVIVIERGRDSNSTSSLSCFTLYCYLYNFVSFFKINSLCVKTQIKHLSLKKKKKKK